MEPAPFEDETAARGAKWIGHVMGTSYGAGCSPWGRRQGAVEVRVDVDVFQGSSQGCEEFVGQ
jgi:hypothetical protein